MAEPLDPTKVVKSYKGDDVWLAPDWSTTSETEKPGYTKVSTSVDVLADGSRVQHILDENKVRIPQPAPPLAGYDQNVKAAWDKEQAQRKPPAKTPAAQAAEETRSATVVREAAEREKNRTLDPSLDPRDETDAQRAARADRTRKEQEAAATRPGAGPRPLTPNTTAQTLETQQPDNTVTSRDNPNYVPPGQRQTAKPPRTVTGVTYPPELNGGKRTAYSDGTTADEQENPASASTATRADAREQRIEEAAVARAKAEAARLNQPVIHETKDGQTLQIFPNGNVNVVATPPSAFGAPPSVSRYTPDYTTPDLGIEARRDELNQHVQAGHITSQQATLILESDYAVANTTAKHGGTLAETQRQTFGDQVTQRGQSLKDAESRRTSATSSYDTALAQFMQGGGKVLPGKGGDSAAAFMAAVGGARRNAQEWGGLPDVPEISLPPWLQSVRDASPADRPLATRPVDRTGPMTAVGPGPLPAAIDATNATTANEIGRLTAAPPAPPVVPVVPVVTPRPAAAAPAPAAAAPVVAPTPRTQLSPGPAGMMMPSSPTVDPSMPSVPTQPQAVERAAAMGYTSPEGPPPLTPAQLGAFVGQDRPSRPYNLAYADPGVLRSGVQPIGPGGVPTYGDRATGAVEVPVVGGPADTLPPENQLVPSAVTDNSRTRTYPPGPAQMQPWQWGAFQGGAVAPVAAPPPPGMPQQTYDDLRKQQITHQEILQAWAEHQSELRQQGAWMR